MWRTAQRLIMLAGLVHDKHETEGTNAEIVMASRFGARCKMIRGLGSGIAAALLLAGIQAHAQTEAELSAPAADQVCPPPLVVPAALGALMDRMLMQGRGWLARCGAAAR